MVLTHWHVFSQTSDGNLLPLETTRFSKQFVPDLASCSLSSKNGKVE